MTGLTLTKDQLLAEVEDLRNRITTLEEECARYKCMEESASKKLTSMSEYNPDPVIEVALTGEIVFLNTTAHTRFRELEGFDDHLHVSPSVRSHINAVLSGEVEDILFELTLGDQDYEVKALAIPELDCVRLYFRDITRRKHLEQERSFFIKQLEDKNEELEQFTYTVSHDLKSPLITISGFAGLLEKDVAAGNSERLRKNIDRIRTAAGMMQTLLNDLLELSRIGRIVDVREDVDLHKLVDEVLSLLSSLITERKIKVTVATDLGSVHGERRRITQVIQNLLENAAKFMGEQTAPEIHVGVRYENERKVFYVEDNGMGIEPAYQEKVFGMFEQLDRTMEGTGIGLALVRRIVESHGGKIWVESEGLGQGSRFCFTLGE